MFDWLVAPVRRPAHVILNTGDTCDDAMIRCVLLVLDSMEFSVKASALDASRELQCVRLSVDTAKQLYTGLQLNLRNWYVVFGGTLRIWRLRRESGVCRASKASYQVIRWPS